MRKNLIALYEWFSRVTDGLKLGLDVLVWGFGAVAVLVGVGFGGMLWVPIVGSGADFWVWILIWVSTTLALGAVLYRLRRGPRSETPAKRCAETRDLALALLAGWLGVFLLLPWVTDAQSPSWGTGLTAGVFILLSALLVRHYLRPPDAADE